MGSLFATSRPRLGPGYAALAALTAVAAAAFTTVVAYRFAPWAPLALIVAGGFVYVALRWPHLGVAGALVALPLDAVNIPLPLGGLSPTDAALGLVGVGYLYRAATRAETIRRPSLRDWPVAVLLVVMLIGVLVVDLGGQFTALRLVALWLLYYLVYLQAQSFTTAEVRQVLVAFGVAGGILGAVGVVSYFTSGEQTVYAGGTATGARAIGAFGDANYYAALLILALVPTVALALRGPRRDGWLLGAAALMIVGIVFSLSRGGLVGMSVGLFTLVLWRRSWPLVGAVIIGATVFSLAGGLSLIGGQGVEAASQRFSTLDPTALSGSSTNSRPGLWETAIAIALDHPFVGVGPEGLQAEIAGGYSGRTEGGDPLENAHNQFVGLAAEQGFVGLAAFLALLATWFARGTRTLRRADRLSRAMTLGLMGGLAGFLVQCLTVQPLRVTAIVAVFFLFGGLLTALSDGSADRRRGGPAPGG